jgi:hypothetical protein
MVNESLASVDDDEQGAVAQGVDDTISRDESQGAVVLFDLKENLNGLEVNVGDVSDDEDGQGLAADVELLGVVAGVRERGTG